MKVADFDLAQPRVLIAAAFVLLIVAVLHELAARFGAKRHGDPEVPANQRTSFIAFLCFGFGMLTGLTVLGAGIVIWIADHHHVVDLGHGDLQYVYLGARITALCALVPALGAVAFWLAARGVVREAQGSLRGVSLYRTGMVITVVSLVCAFGFESSVFARATKRMEQTRDGSHVVSVAAPDKDVEGCRALIGRLAEAVREYREGEGRFPETGGDELFRALQGRYLNLSDDQHRNNRILDPWGNRIEWVRSKDQSYLIYSHGPDGVDNGGREDDVSARVRDE